MNEKGLQKIQLEFAHPIEEEGCRVELSVSLCQILIKKKDVAKNWEKVEQGLNQQGNMRSGVTSSKVKRDWSKIDKDIEKDLSKEKQGDPMNDLFRQIYSNGNEETRTAMIKSFQTSGGTVLYLFL